MPSGNVHKRINFSFLPLFLISILLIGSISFKYALIFSLGFSFGTLYLDPDLDIRSNSFKRWGILRFIWIPYQKIFPHRSILSHGILIGDIIRIVYLLCVISFFIYAPQILFKYLGIDKMNLVLLLIAGILFMKVKTKKKGKKRKKAATNYSLLPFFILTIVWLQISHAFPIIDVIEANYHRNNISYWFFPIGIVLSSLIHTISDIVFSAFKRIS